MGSRPVEQLVGSVAERIDAVTDRVLACFRAEIPAYAVLADPDLRPGVRSNVERALEALRRGWQPTPAELVAARALGEQRAQQGLPLDALLQAHRIGVREALAVARQAADERGIGAEDVLDLATRAWAWADAVMVAAAGGHRERELDLAGQEQRRRAHLLRGMLQGALDEASLRAVAAVDGIALRERYVPLCADGPGTELRRFERTLGQAAAAAGCVLLTGALESGLDVIVGPADEPVARDLVGRAHAAAEGVLIALGPPARPGELAPAYALARRTLQAARALGRQGLAELTDVALHVGVLAQPEIGDLLERRHLDALDREGEFGAELISTIETWYAHGMRTEQTAAALFVHANTVRHRLRRLEALTGLSLDRTGDRIELWWALTHRRLRGLPGA